MWNIKQSGEEGKNLIADTTARHFLLDRQQKSGFKSELLWRPPADLEQEAAPSDPTTVGLGASDA